MQIKYFKIPTLDNVLISFKFFVAYSVNPYLSKTSSKLNLVWSVYLAPLSLKVTKDLKQKG